jgi:zinc transport system ATP-binding protein
MKKKEIIKIKDVFFGYEKSEDILKGVTFSVYEDDFLGIIGPNGGGKTTLLKLILGLLKPRRGKISILNSSPKKARDKIGYLSQFKNIDFDFPITAYQIVLLGRVNGNIFKHYTRKDRLAVKRILKKLNIWKLKNKKLNELSGGEKQMVFVARALVNNPKILFLDEPMSNLDIHHQEDFYQLLQKLNKEVTIIIIEHDLDMVKKYAKDVVCVDRCEKGAVRYHGSELTEVNIKKACAR